MFWGKRQYDNVVALPGREPRWKTAMRRRLEPLRTVGHHLRYLVPRTIPELEGAEVAFARTVLRTTRGVRLFAPVDRIYRLPDGSLVPVLTGIRWGVDEIHDYMNLNAQAYILEQQGHKVAGFGFWRPARLDKRRGVDFDYWEHRHLCYQKLELGDDRLNTYAACQRILFDRRDPYEIRVNPAVCQCCGCYHERLCRGPGGRYSTHPRWIEQKPATLKVVNGRKSH